MAYTSYVEESGYMFFVAVFLTVILSFFTMANMLKLIRGYPYITITTEYIQLDTATKSEVTIYFTDIESIKGSQVFFQDIIEIVLHDEADYFARLSFHNKVRLFMNRLTGFSLFTISPKAIVKQHRSTLLQALDIMVSENANDEIPNYENVKK